MNPELSGKVEKPLQLPIQGVSLKVTANNSLLKTKLTITYLNDSESKVEAILEMPSNPDLVISKLKIKVGDSQEITGIVKDKEKAREQYDDAIAAGHQAGMLEMKDDQEDKVLQMRLGNIEPK